MEKKQEQYIVREREYRQTIKEMEETVKKVSKNPLELIPESTQDEAQLQKIEEQLGSTMAAAHGVTTGIAAAVTTNTLP